MTNKQIEKIAKYIYAVNSDINITDYRKQLNILYGAIYEFTANNEDYSQELIAIEEERLKLYGISISKRITNPIALLTEYSLIAFFLAQKSYMNKEKWAVAPLLKNIMEQLFSSELIDEKNRKDLRILISEAELDFGYAAGNHAVSSMRMAQILRNS